MSMEFLVLPDHPAGTALAARVPRQPRGTVVNHASGRPWILGTWDPRRAVIAAVGRTRAIALGTVGADATRLARALRAVHAPADVDTLARALPGAHHLLVSLDGRVRAQGTLSTSCRIFHTTVGAITLAAGHPAALAALTGAGIDEELLAAQLLGPYGPPWPLNARCLWRGVRTVPPGRYLDLTRDGTGTTVPYWTPPTPDVPLVRAAPALRDALETAVRARVEGRATVSADLSGGKDSTSLCFLAARGGARLVTVHLQSSDPGNEDRLWVARAAHALPGARHLTVPMAQGPGMFADGATPPPDGVEEAPLTFVRRPLVEFLAGLAADHGSTVHLQGMGSDELFLPGPMSLTALVQDRLPALPLTTVRATRATHRWSWPVTARLLCYRAPYHRWLRAVADTLTRDRPTTTTPGWEILPRMVPWATPDAVDAVRGLLRRVLADGAEPLAPLPLHHDMLRLTQVNGMVARSATRIGQRHGVTIESPYLDDRVIEAAMAVRPGDRIAPGRVKPVLTAALRGLVPDDLLDRRTKADASPDLYGGLRRHRRRLTDLFEDSHLARMGLVDADGVREVLGALHTDTWPLMPLELTLAGELWLRSLPPPTGAAPAPPTPSPAPPTPA
ncbi:asparagine synthase-related protein [Streptomyces sp. NPDC057638]|uniref:asparagine synthase-related protein n=1 Tax=Streptomyces sp. NPDC057638 TaxID=3346190 RepID=UPI0036D11346